MENSVTPFTVSIIPTNSALTVAKFVDSTKQADLHGLLMKFDGFSFHIYKADKLLKSSGDLDYIAGFIDGYSEERK